ncbi:alpha/beta fold hydrolase [Ectothiorhodospira lacustris]|uniref:alpha/beta fold hydrolase n=1 Tax=Ectothiorhodospira lacustris TaxID=2899127 RepID=UPI001EE90465|nr:alpha/beta fold hydrolase [Ectothiorhodospira lacustris]MCG5502008.1 alpha/beta fold hydrolase [Ectothiorhodospira lacustris]MCG5511365.1 alpha/beta fold hydrolase [Ectothiorhodospira lacustris]MCG5523151.1 alpha/beta fold hydrolase [Ectothiorhodospira lacustris]
MSLRLHHKIMGSGPPLLLLHGLYGSGVNWQGHARTLAARYRVLLPDLRNHGQSPHTLQMDYPAMATDLLALLNREDLEQALVVGHSMGGKVAMTLAQHHPERVRALVVADIAPVDYALDDREHTHILDSLQHLPLADLSRREDADIALARAIPETAVRRFLLMNLERGPEGFRWRIPLDILQQALPTLVGYPGIDARYEGPTLFIRGERSDYVKDEYRPLIEARFPRARLMTLKGTGHWLHVQAPEPFGRILQGFLDRHADNDKGEGP